MKLSKPLYEKLPLIYFVSSLAVFFNYNSLITNISAAVIFFVSALVWVKRSDYRRQTRINQTVNHFRLPQVVYEYYPFVFLAIAFSLVKYYPQPLGLAIALILTLIAVKNLFVRHQSRMNPLKFGGNHIHKS
ncbi:hypothetical protein [Thalassomonas sp. M1454]|uniref:hypothetical protein n=1 Tax=Thalassomonas sp. M1454 TaxID=2594477 RepID=UPI00117E84B4|nr:hypothetical protein [Thalassomonas sp. M1454]TRX56432.1 hypothetical protein FNN08_02565 [Thalassomonas sp. M1454]